jgi:(1->4)-alpha-D-glucan 1-alpha-D-glucosylmutase
MTSLRVPTSTYRLQFNSDLKFNDARSLVSYLNSLGITDIYSSPIFKTRPASSHGYDITDPRFLNRELGTEEEFHALISTLRDRGMGLMLDIVPNHMSTNPENPFWTDLLENGRFSPFAYFFDIDWDSPCTKLRNRILLPILGTPYPEALENGELRLSLEEGGFSLNYFDLQLPIDIKSIMLLLSHRIGSLEKDIGSANAVLGKLKNIIDGMNGLLPHDKFDMTRATENYNERLLLKKELLILLKESPEIRKFLQRNIGLFNGEKGEPHSIKLLDELLKQQPYYLAFWRTGRNAINYRRFFDIDELIGVKIEDPLVFDTSHTLILRLIQEGKITGLRIDHIDGLYDPLQYLNHLQHHAAAKANNAGKSPGMYVVVEKILANDEPLSDGWPVYGTTGYDYLNLVNTLFISNEGIPILNSIYSRFTGDHDTFDDVVYKKKRQVIDELFAADFNMLVHQLEHLVKKHDSNNILTYEQLKKALVSITACLPVYRTYINNESVNSQDRLHIERSVQKAWQREPNLDGRAMSFMESVLLLKHQVSCNTEYLDDCLHFVMRWQQVTGAVMAKGFEDTALYTNNRLVSLNDVGSDPESKGLSIEEFHRKSMHRHASWPHTMNTTSTHDTKRGEDVRARLNVISELAEDWGNRLLQWNKWNLPAKQTVAGKPVPEPSMEVLIYQTLLGAWPNSEEEQPDFVDRFKSYLIKGAREAKTYTSWLSNNMAYEDALLDFTDSILERSRYNKFLADFFIFQRKLAFYGAINSLAQVVLKATSPGVPDFYQGTELWDLNLVDPDNRRPIDYQKRIQLLDNLILEEGRGVASLTRNLLNYWEDGAVKLYTIYKILNMRREYTDLFKEGDYIPLQIDGHRQEHICAFSRFKDNKWTVVVVPRLMTGLVRFGTPPLGKQTWGDDLLLMPRSAPKDWSNIFTNENLHVSASGNCLPLSQIFYTFPVAVLSNAN